jgi:hypothetical protein
MARALTHALSHPIHEGLPTTGRIRPSKWDITSEFFHSRNCAHQDLNPGGRPNTLRF